MSLPVPFPCHLHMKHVASTFLIRGYFLIFERISAVASTATLARASPDHRSCFLSSIARDALPNSSAALLAVPGSVSPSAALESGCEKDRYVSRRRRDTQESHCCQSTLHFAQVLRPMLQADVVSCPSASPPDAPQQPSVVHAPVASDVRGPVGFVLEAAASSLSSCSF